MVKKAAQKATKRPSVVVTVSRALNLTAAQIASLKSYFKADLTRVLAARGGEGGPPPLPDVNVGGGAAGAGRGPTKKAAKKSPKKK
jgi:hypothetical protein